MHRVWCWCATSVLVASALAGQGLREKRVDIAIDAAGAVHETVRLRVSIDSAEDRQRWQTYAVYLDDHRRLTSLEAWTVAPDGKRRRVGRKQRTQVGGSGGGSLHDSAVFEVLEMADLDVGWHLEIDHAVAIEPYFPAGEVVLLGDGPVADLEVRLHGKVSGLRWHLEGEPAGLQLVSVAQGGLVVSGRLGEFDDGEPLAPAGAGPVLRYAWGDATTWDAVAQWYRDLLGTTASGTTASASVVGQVESLIAGIESPRGRFEALLEHVRQKVRYVAVEVGIGGYRPTPAAETLQRRWGDCKDKSLLLIEMLAAVGIEAYPALILLDQDARIDTGFPTPFVFNHLIVAVSAAGLDKTSNDPVAEDLLFVDPTQTQGGPHWLHAGVQDQDALVVLNDGGRLVRTPTMPSAAARVVTVELAVRVDGSGQADVTIEGTGRLAAAVAIREQQGSRAAVEAELRDVVAAWFPGATIGMLDWQMVDHDLPRVRLRVGVDLARVVEGQGERRALRLPGLPLWPAPRDLVADRVDPAVLLPGVFRTSWQIRLPNPACVPDVEPVALESPLGHFRQTVEDQGEGLIVVTREAAIRARWIEPDGIGEVRDLALAEHRTLRRRLRLRCLDTVVRDTAVAVVDRR